MFMPPDVSDLLWSAWESVHIGDIEEALSFANKAVQKAPNFDEGYLQLGLAYERLTKFDQAEACYLKARELRPASAKPDVALARLYRATGNTNAEASTWRRAAAKPDSYEVAIARGLVATEKGDLESALRHFHQAMLWYDETPSIPFADGSWPLRASGLVLLRLRRYSDAAVCFREAKEKRGGDALLFYSLGLTFWFLKKYRAAREEFTEAVRIDPNYREAHLGLTRVEFRMGRWVSAFRHFRRVVELTS